MMKSYKSIALMLALGSVAYPASVWAADAETNDRLNALEARIKALQEELTQAKAQSASTAINDLKDQVELNHKESVVGGDIPGSFRLPGSETSVHIFGFAETHALKDFKTTAPGDYFSNIQEQPTAPGAPTGQSRFTAQTSRLGFETTTPTSSTPLHTMLEADFYGYCNDNPAAPANANDCNRNRLRIRHAYGEYGGFLIGQTWSTWMDGDNAAETVDFNGPVGAPFARLPMLHWATTYQAADPNVNTKVSVAVEDPFAWGSASITTGTKADITQSRPNLVLHVDHHQSWGELTGRLLSSNIRMNGVTANGYGIGLGGSYKPNDVDTFIAQYSYVKGDYNGEYQLGANGASFNSLTNQVMLDRTAGFQLGYQHIFSPMYRVNLAYGQMNDMSGADYVANYGAGANKRLSQYHINLIYTPIKNVDLGIEYVGGRRTTYDGTNNQGNLSRLDLMGRYSF